MQRFTNSWSIARTSRPIEAVEALAAELGMTAAVARTFVRKELAALAKMAQTRSVHAAMDRGRGVGARAQQRRALRLHALGHVQAQVHALAARAIVADAAAANDDDENGVDGGAGNERALPRAPMPRLTAEELRSALGVRRCEGSPLFPECVLPMRASGGASACFLCAPPRGGSGQRSASSWGDLWSLVDEVAAQGLEEAVLAGLAGADNLPARDRRPRPSGRTRPRRTASRWTRAAASGRAASSASSAQLTTERMRACTRASSPLRAQHAAKAIAALPSPRPAGRWAVGAACRCGSVFKGSAFKPAFAAHQNKCKMGAAPLPATTAAAKLD
jgi:hypothetical protein